ncbi:hypothetical protein [Aeromicrobium sp. 50.2.37]|uniref:hypothetical protein n=1 Tax=Aeromicrobium sp. 50.2.37 TaxID=2969305 RepID=UPI0021503813|nr:hypothetical protein [Aeromicrobium sp. 50.2.37]MCR4512546.1 hypothetical protein [Aeromicrobium sp. 50.2.37]
MRVWVGVDADGLRRLRDGGALGGEVVAAESEDEQHEYEALVAAAEDGPVVVVADVEATETGGGTTLADVTAADVEALHVDADGSGQLAWYAPQEIEAVLSLLG